MCNIGGLDRPFQTHAAQHKLRSGLVVFSQMWLTHHSLLHRRVCCLMVCVSPCLELQHDARHSREKVWSFYTSSLSPPCLVFFRIIPPRYHQCHCSALIQCFNGSLWCDRAAQANTCAPFHMAQRLKTPPNKISLLTGDRRGTTDSCVHYISRRTPVWLKQTGSSLHQDSDLMRFKHLVEPGSSMERQPYGFHQRKMSASLSDSQCWQSCSLTAAAAGPRQTRTLQRFTLLCCFISDCVLQKEDRVQLDLSLKIPPAFFSLCLNLEVYFHPALLWWAVVRYEDAS